MYFFLTITVNGVYKQAVMTRKKILFIVGSMNQSSQMHQIASFLKDDYDCFFTQFFGRHPIIRLVKKLGFMEQTILSGHFKANSEAFLVSKGWKMDQEARQLGNEYDLVVACNDLIMPHVVRRAPSIWVQEGMIDPLTTWSKVVKFLKLPRYLAMGTALNGASNMCDIFCAGSNGYIDYLTKMGTERNKLIVSGIPNFDNAFQFLDNNFEHKGYVMVATSDIRETFRKEDRISFIKKAVKIAKGRQLLFKLHPNEMYDRACSEIKNNAPVDTLIYQEGNTNEMIANCEELITQWSSVVYIGMALGKPVHSYFQLKELKRLAPLQNNGTSAEFIANLCKEYLNYGKKDGPGFLKQYKQQQNSLTPKLYKSL